MKIHEIIAEGDISDIGQLTVNAVNKGSEVGSKIFSPSQWFKSKNVDVDVPDETGATTKVKATPAPKKTSQPVQTHNIRFSLQKAAKGEQLYNDDISYLKAAYGKVDQGTPEADALSAAIKIQPLNKQQQAVLLNLSKQY
jgi:hypothetical protein